jgi:cobalt transporter subunit CbtA
MHLFRAIILAAALAGGLAGLFMTMAQQVGTVPLIQEAEVHEQAAADHDHGDHEHAWAPDDGHERTAFTLMANLVAGVGFALLLTAGYALRGRSVGWREGLAWGVAGFAVFSLAPFLGLPPELPGMPEAPLVPRQVWWLATVGATALGLGLLAFRRSPATAVAAVALLAAPHLVGAPQPTEAASLVPDALAQRFVVAATVTSLLFWALLGVLSALFFAHFGRDSLRAPASLPHGSR